MKIALYCRVWPSHGIGGMQVAAREAATSLANRGHKVHVFTTALPTFNGTMPDEKLTVHYLPAPVGKYSSEYFDSAYALFNKIGGFDVVYTHSTAGRRHLGKGVPLVAHWHGIGGMEDVKNLAKIGRKVSDKKFDLAILDYPWHIAIAPHEARYLVVNGVDVGRVETIPFGTDGFREDPLLRKEIREKLGFSSLDFVVGVSGRLVTDKGVGQVASILPLLAPQVRILLVGDGGLAGAFQERTVHVRSVDREKMGGYYNAMDLFLDPTTRNQGFDIAPIEAALCGTPLLLSDVGSFRKVFSRGARFFELGDLAGLSFEINGLAQAGTTLPLRSEIGTLAQALFEKELMGRRIEAILAKAIAE